MNENKKNESTSESLIPAKSKTISVSSTESLPDIECITDKQQQHHQEQKTDVYVLDSKFSYENSSSELFDFAKTGAIPKNNKTINNPNSKSSLSSSTSSSLSSLISSAPSTFSSSSSYNLKSKKKTSTNNYESNYWGNQDKFDENFKANKTKLNTNYQDEDENSNMLNEFKETITCPLCFKPVVGTIESHFESEHNEYECPFCDLLFDNDFVLNQHVNTVHNDDSTTKKENDFLIDSKLPNYSASGASNWSQNDFKSVSDSVNEQKCPVCMIVVKEGLEHLQAHVESHFNNPTAIDIDYDDFKNKSRSNSASSLIANVDENFEMDQVMTLSDSDTTNPYYSFQNDNKDEEDLMQKDYEMALLLDQQENDKHITRTNDFILAQMYDRQQAESSKYAQTKQKSNENLCLEEEYSTETSSNFQSDFEYAAELEHEWLKQKYGMTEVKASSKAICNLDRALKQNKIDIVTYNYEKDQIENRISSLFDDGSTCSKDVIQLIVSTSFNKTTTKRMICTKCDHYASGFIDSGYGCGYRNTQMILSSIREDPALRDTLFNNNNKSMPSITKIQKLIENAWNNGFDVAGKAQLGGSLEATSKWIGASDVCAMFSSLRIKTELVDIVSAKNNVSSILFKFVRNYFEEAEKTSNFVHPIYLQHDGHSRLIVGIEMGQHESLLLFDPGTRKYQVDQFKKNKSKFISIFRRGMASFKKKEYQLLLVKGVYKSNDDYERAKMLVSKRVTS